MPKKKITEDYAEELKNSFERWDHLYKHGGSDPFWSDGCNLNLVRNHIFYYKSQIEETFEPQNYPEIYYKDAPPEVPHDYMARSDEIRENAKNSLQIYKQDENYKYLLTKVDRLRPKDAKDVCINAVVNYVAGLEMEIDSDDLIGMRRHENPNGYLESFRSCAEKVKALKPIENEQLSIFFSDFYTEENEPDEEQDMDEDENQGMDIGMNM